MKENKRTFAIMMIVLLLPIVVGVLLWNRLPDEMPSHWDFSGNVNNYTNKALMVFGVPVFEIALIWFSLWIIEKDPKRANIRAKSMNLVLWMVVIVCVTAQLSSYMYAMGVDFNVVIVSMYIMGIFFILLGNRMPKMEQSYTFGIRTPWTLDSVENWRLTHRFAGKIFVLGGFLTIITAMLNLPGYVFLIILIITCLAPIIYSAKIDK